MSRNILHNNNAENLLIKYQKKNNCPINNQVTYLYVTLRILDMF